MTTEDRKRPSMHLRTYSTTQRYSATQHHTTGS